MPITQVARTQSRVGNPIEGDRRSATMNHLCWKTVRRRAVPTWLAVGLVLTAPVCSVLASSKTVILTTTTSTQDSGLLDVLVPLFEEQTGYSVKVIAVGTGQALEMGQEGNADVLLVHAPASEETFMADGYGTDRFLVMHNDFIIVGPASDPAGLKGGTVAVDALTKIYESGSPFISRGDKSGTHSKELALWKAASLDPETAKPAWYSESGQGMGATVMI